MDWDGFENAWHDHGCRALADLAGEPLYAAAFHLFYADGTQIVPPALAANTEAAGYDDSTRFAPPEWRWDVLEAASEAMRPWYQRLTEEFLTPGGATLPAHGAALPAHDAALPAHRAALPAHDAALPALEAAHDGAMARVCRRMTATARRGGVSGSLTPGFAVLILEGQRGDAEADVLRASVDPQILPTVPSLAEYLSEFGRPT